MSTENLIDVHGAAALLCMSETWVYQRVAANEIPFVKLGRAVRFDPSALRAWATQQGSAR